MTKEEYIKYILEDTREYLERQFEENDFASIQSLLKYKTLSDEQLNLMGYEKTYEEMLKYIPKCVTDKTFVPRDCTTYGKCPTCGSEIQDGIARTDNPCPKCNQVLLWNY